MSRRTARSAPAAAWLLLLLLVLRAQPATGREAGDAIRMKWIEGDVAGMSSILSPDGKSTIGYIEFHQWRRGKTVEMVRVAHFKDGSSDEDRAEAEVGETLRTLRGRSIIRNTSGVATVDLTIDVIGGRISGFSGLGEEREEYDEKVELPPGTYWGPMIFLVVKNFETNAEDGRVVFRTVIATPKPRVIDMEVLPQDRGAVLRAGGSIDVVRYALRPTVNWIVDPIIRLFVPDTDFLVDPGTPPALARFDGPRNYAGQKIRIE